MRNTVLITIAAALVAVALLFIPVDPAMPPQSPTEATPPAPPADAAAPAATVQATEPSPPDPPKRPDSPLDADCGVVGDRLSRISSPAFSDQVRLAAEAKFTTDQIIAKCRELQALDDAALLAALKEEYGLTP